MKMPPKFSVLLAENACGVWVGIPPTWSDDVRDTLKGYLDQIARAEYFCGMPGFFVADGDGDSLTGELNACLREASVTAQLSVVRVDADAVPPVVRVSVVEDGDDSILTIRISNARAGGRVQRLVAAFADEGGATYEDGRYEFRLTMGFDDPSVLDLVDRLKSAGAVMLTDYVPGELS